MQSGGAHFITARGNKSRQYPHLLLTTALTSVLLLSVVQAGAQEQASEDEAVLETIVISAEQQLKQAPGVSTVTSEDLQKTPPANDLSEIIRKMPGVNLTGTTSTGQRGNQRQIDLRGMGPENTLILIDGKPVLSRNSVRMGRVGERDSRGDTNWVPPEAVDRIEVIRGPAAARYGSGAAGGVVNIITKRPDKLGGTVSTYLSAPQHSEEGGTRRGSVLLGGPINETLSFRLLGSYNKTDADDADINAGADPSATPAAGREGVINRDVRALLSIEPTADHIFDIEAAYGRQNNIFAGDRQLATSNPVLESLIGGTTNRITRKTLSLTHRGAWDFGDSNSYIQWERTSNWRYLEGLAGSGEGAINVTDSATAELDNLTAKSEWTIPVETGVPQTLTLGAEFRGEWMDDPASMRVSLNPGVVIPGVPGDTTRDPKSDAWLAGLYLEDNIMVTDRLTLTPGLRFDYHDSFGANWSPSLNASYDLTDEVTIKAGLARAFKAPNLFQLNPNYVYFTMGNGCPVGYPSGGCYVVGNADLDAETSFNKEIGINYSNDDGWNAGLTYFHNDYKDRISAGTTAEGLTGTYNYFRWENVPKAVVSGLEGNLSIPLGDVVTWSTNATYMIQSEDKSTGNPLSLIPDYTINTSLDWQAREDLNFILSATHYGETKAAENCTTRTSCSTWNENNMQSRDPYTLVNIGFKYDINEAFTLSGGVNNVFDKRVLREGSGDAAGANTYNEPGRTFYVGLSATF